MNTITLPRILIAVGITALISSCTLTKLQRQENRVARKIEKLEKKFPEAFDNVNEVTLKIDTVIQKVEVKGEVKTDTVTVDKILTEVIDNPVEVVRYRERLIEKIIPTIRKDTLGITLFITGTPDGLMYNVIRDPIHIEAEKKVDRITITKTEVVRRPFWRDWKFWILLVLYVLFLIFKNAIKTYFRGISPFK